MLQVQIIVRSLCVKFYQVVHNLQQIEFLSIAFAKKLLGSLRAKRNLKRKVRNGCLFLLLFFVRSGVSFQLDALVNTSVAVGNTPLLVVGIVYFLTRIVGKYAGAFGGCWLSGKRKEVRNYLGLALIPQAGVAIGLAALGARTLGGETGVALETVILASSIMYELIGPACAKLSLYLSKSYSTKLEDLVPTEEVDDNGEQKSAVELLIERIQAIQTEIPHMTVSDEEQAFLEAAEEQIAALSTIHTGAVRNRRSML